jgi:heme a synthase
VAAVAHTAGAAALVVVLTWTLCESRAGAAARAGLKPQGLSA